MGRWMPLNLPFGQPPPHLAQASPARLARVCRASACRSRNRAARAAPVHLDAPVDPPVGILAEGVHDKVEHQGPALGVLEIRNSSSYRNACSLCSLDSNSRMREFRAPGTCARELNQRKAGQRLQRQCKVQPAAAS